MRAEMMRATAVTLLVSATAGWLSGCGDPITVLGDNPNTMRVVAGVPEAPGKTSETKATASLFREPAGLVLGAGGLLYLADSGNRRVVAIASNGDLAVIKDDGFCTGVCLIQPTALAFDPSGRLVVTDPAGNRIWRVDPATGDATVLAGTGERISAPDGVAAGQAPVAQPIGVAVDPDGTIYFTEAAANRVRRIDPNGTLGTVAGTGERSFSGDGGPAAAATLDFPTGLARFATTLYVVDAGNDRVRAIDLPAGAITTVVGNGVRGFAGDGGPALEAAIDVPEAIAITPDGGRLYLADTRNHRIRLVSMTQGTIQTFAGTGETDFSGDLRDAGATSLFLPAGVATSDLGLLFIGDTGHHIAWRVPTDF